MRRKIHVNKKILIILIVPFFIIAQFYLFKYGILSPQVKGLEVEVVKGQYIKDIDKYVIKLNNTITLSTGDYVKFPTYAKNPIVEFKNLNDNNIIKIEDNSDKIKNTANITGIKTGVASVAVVKNGRILKKFNILVVDPKVTDLNTEIDGSLNYVGDDAVITNSVEVDFDRFKDKYDVKYKSSNEKVLKLKGNKIYAVGVGKATITANLDSKKERFAYNIVAKIKNIKVESDIDLEVGQSKKIYTNVVTSPNNLPTPKVKFKFADKKLPIDRKVRLDDDGVIVGLRPGTEKLIVSCGKGKNKVEKYIYVNVEKLSIKGKSISNFYLNYYFVDNKLVLDLRWNKMRGVTKYEVYMKDNTKLNSHYRLLKVLKSSELSKEENTINQILKLNYDNTKDADYDIYIVGKNGSETTKKSKVYNIKNNKNDETGQEEEDNLGSENNQGNENSGEVDDNIEDENQQENDNNQGNDNNQDNIEEDKTDSNTIENPQSIAMTTI